MPWINKDLIARITANVVDATELADNEAAFVELAGDSPGVRTYQVTSQTVRGNRYVVKLDLRGNVPPTEIRKRISCTCPGYLYSLGRKDPQTGEIDDRVCKHCGAALYLCFQKGIPTAKKSLPADTFLRPRQPIGAASSSADHVPVPPKTALAKSGAIARTGSKPLAPAGRGAIEDQARGLASQVEHRPQSRPEETTGRSAPTERKETVGKSGPVPHYRSDASARGRAALVRPLAEEVPKPLLPFTQTDADSDAESGGSAAGEKVPLGGNKKKAEKTKEAQDDAVTALTQRAKSAARLFRRKTSFEVAFEDYDSDPLRTARLLAGQGGGMLRSFMNGEETLAMASYMLDRCGESAVLTCFTFDSMEVAISLANAAKRGRKVTVYADRNHLISGTTKCEVDRMEYLRDGGVNVRLVTGRSGQVPGCSGNFAGIQHSKALLVDQHAIVGSTNWTNAARKNHEISVLISLAEEGLCELNQWHEILEKMSHGLTDGDLKQGRAHRAGDTKSARTRSSDAQKGNEKDLDLKFSIARSRAASAGKVL